MNHLDDLLSMTGRVPEISDQGLGNGRQKLAAAIAQVNADQAPAHPKVLPRWRGSWRGLTAVAATAAVGAAAAVAGATLLPSAPSAPSAPSTTGPQATAKAAPAADPGAEVTLSSVSYRIDTTASSISAAAVLDAAAAAIGTQAGTAPAPNVDWSEPYFHTVQVTTCNGGAITYNSWETRTGDGAGEEASRGCTDQEADRLYPVITLSANFYRLGNQSLTESQVDQLPTDPAKLWPLLEGFDGGSLSTDTANPDSNASMLFQSIWNMITSEPLSPAFRRALLEDAAKIPGVTVEGKYTDSLGRTGTVLHIGIWTIAVDTVDGQILSMTNNAAPGIPICSKVPAHDLCQPGGSSTTVYVSAQLVSGTPKAVAGTIAYAKAHEPTVRIAPVPTPQL